MYELIGKGGFTGGYFLKKKKLKKNFKKRDR